MKVFFDTNVYVAEAFLGGRRGTHARGDSQGLMAHPGPVHWVCGTDKP
jgi:hypothetical protein